MGRVYNALLKADRLPGRDPIGRPAAEDAGVQGRDDTATQRRGDAVNHRPAQPSRVNAANLSAVDATTQAASDANRANNNAINQAFDQQNQYRTPINQEDAAQPASFEFELNASLSEAFIGRRTPPVITPQPANRVAASPRPQVPVSPRPHVPAPPAASPLARSQSVDQAATPQTANSVAALPQPRVAAPPQFVEPRGVVSVKSLSLDARLAALTASNALTCERYRTLAVRTTALAARRNAKTLLVTSADDGEGKSTIAANLAWTMAQRTERRVLLLDVNLRNAAVGRALKVAPARGWIEIADVTTELTDAFVRLDPNGLYVMLPQGKQQNAPVDAVMLEGALASTRFEKLLAALAKQFDYVILDGPALLGSADAQQLAAITDGTILVTRAGQTPHRHVTDALELVPQERRFGVVLNEAESAEPTATRPSTRRSRLGRLFGRA